MQFISRVFLFPAVSAGNCHGLLSSLGLRGLRARERGCQAGSAVSRVGFVTWESEELTQELTLTQAPKLLPKAVLVLGGGSGSRSGSAWLCPFPLLY